MFAIEQKRRSFLLGLGSIGISQLVVQGVPPAQAAAPVVRQFVVPDMKKISFCLAQALRFGTTG